MECQDGQGSKKNEEKDEEGTDDTALLDLGGGSISAEIAMNWTGHHGHGWVVGGSGSGSGSGSWGGVPMVVLTEIMRCGCVRYPCTYIGK